MRFKFGYTGIRVRDLDRAIQFFTDVLGMKLQARIKFLQGRFWLAFSIAKPEKA